MTILVTGAFQLNDEQRSCLEASGHKVFFVQYEKDPLPIPCDQIEGVICNGLFLHHPIDKFTSLRFIQLTSAGFDRIPMEYVRQNGIEIHNAKGVYSIPMAEFAVSSVLELYKQWDHFRKSQESHSWIKHRGLRELYGKTVCILGCGNVGCECAKRFGAFGCNVVGVDLTPMKNEHFSEIFPVCEMRCGLSNADIIVLTLPLTAETRRMFSQNEFDSLKDGCIVINIARGAIIDNNAMIKALSEREIFAVLDVFEEEPISQDSPLWDMENVMITPHNSFVGEGNADRMWSVVKKNLSI